MLGPRSVLAVFLAVLAGCTGPAGPGVATEGNTVVPVAAPDPWGGTDAALLAAGFRVSEGGLAPGRSGVSAVLVLADGSVLVAEGAPWQAGRMDPPGTPCPELQATFDRIGAARGRNASLDCARDGVVAVHAGTVPAEAWPGIRDHLGAIGALDVPAGDRGRPCCDRVFTDHHLFLRDGEDLAVSEDRAPSSGAPHWDLLAELDALAAWLRS